MTGPLLNYVPKDVSRFGCTFYSTYSTSFAPFLFKIERYTYSILNAEIASGRNRNKQPPSPMSLSRAADRCFFSRHERTSQLKTSATREKPLIVPVDTSLRVIVGALPLQVCVYTPAMYPRFWDPRNFQTWIRRSVDKSIHEIFSSRVVETNFRHLREKPPEKCRSPASLVKAHSSRKTLGVTFSSEN